MSNLVEPHGSKTLKPLIVRDKGQIEELKNKSATLSKIIVNSSAASNAVMLGAGYFTPLSGFMGKKDTMSVAENMVTGNGLFWPIPIINLVKKADGINVGEEISLLDPNIEGNPVLALQEVSAIEELSEEEVEKYDIKLINT